MGEPVSATTGAFIENHVDLQVNSPLPIVVRRTYSSLNAGAPNELGNGWLPGYASYLVPSDDGSTIQAADTDGSVVMFRLEPGLTNVWAPTVADNPGLINSGGSTNLYNSTIVQTGSGVGATYEWLLPDGSARIYTVQYFSTTAHHGVTYTRQRPDLTSWIDNRGNTLSFTFNTTDPTANDYGFINQVQSSNGSWVKFVYDAQGHITQAAANDGRTVNYTYNPDGDLTAVRLPDGSETDYQYGVLSNNDSNHLIIQKTSPGGRIIQNVYDGANRVVQQHATVDQTNPAALVLTATYDYSVFGQTTIRDAYNQPTVYQYDPTGLITKITDPLGNYIQQTWCPATDPTTHAYLNSLQSVTDKRGLVTTYQYDAQGDITQTQITGDLTGDGTSQTAITSATYDTLSRCLTATDVSGILTTFTYGDSNYPYLPTQIATSKNGTPLRTDTLAYTAKSDANGISKGLLQTKTVAYNTSDQAVTTYDYNSAGFMTRQTAQTGTTDPAVVTNYAPTARNELGTVTDADNRSTTYTYDGMSRVLSKTVKDEASNTLGVWTTTYTGEGDVSLTSGPHTAPANTVQRTYGTDGNLAEVDVAVNQAKSDGSGVTTTTLTATTDYGYDFVGNLVSASDPLGNVTTMTYDGNGQMLGRSTYQGSNTMASPLRTESWQYEPGGKVSQYTNPLGGVANTYYSATGQIRRQENPDGSVFQWRYQTDGRLQKQILRDGSYWLTTYDDINRTVTRALTLSDGITVLATDTSIYDRRGNLVSHTDTDGFVHTATYDGLNRAKTVTGPPALSLSNGAASSQQQITTFVYGASAKTVAAVNALGESTITTSDALGRPVQTLVLNSSSAVIRTTSYAYSADNNSVTIVDGTGTGAISRISYTDTLNRPVLTVLGDGTYTSKTYDLDGNVAATTDALGQSTTYGYNALGQATSQTLPDLTVTNFTYDGAGDLLTRVMANGTLTQSQTYDNAGRKTAESLFSASLTTRNYSYTYYPAGSPFVGLLQTVTGPRDAVTATYDNFLRPSTVATLSLSNGSPELNSSTTYTYNNRGLVIGIAQSSASNAAGPATNIARTYDGYGQLLTETDTSGGATVANLTQIWDAAGRRASLNDASSSLPAPLFAYTHRADGLLAQVTANNQNYGFSYADNGLLTARTNPFRTLTIDQRDPVGRMLHETTTVGGGSPLIESAAYRNDGTLSAYVTGRSDGWNEHRNYSYNARGQLTSEGFSPAVNAANTLNYAFDGNNGLGVRTGAKVDQGAPASWETIATPDSLGRVATDNVPAASGHAVPATGSATGADHVDILIDGAAQGRASYSSDAWSFGLDLVAGSHTLTANAVDPSGLYIASATSNFTVTAANPAEQTGTVTSSYDAEGNVITRSWASGLTQTLTWDAFNRLIKVSQRDTSHNGYDWTAIYDGLGRRLAATQQPVVNNVANGAATATTSTFDPEIEFLEIGVAVNGAKSWLVRGPDSNGVYGGLQGTGGLEATVLDSNGTTKGLINDFFGNGVASISGTNVSWFTTKVGGYGPLPGSVAEVLTDITRVAEASAWRGRRIDPTGLYCLGTRYYEPTSGRFLSTDPMGQAASMSLYDFCNGDPVNFFDPDGRCADKQQAIDAARLRTDIASELAQQYQADNAFESALRLIPGAGLVFATPDEEESIILEKIFNEHGLYDQADQLHRERLWGYPQRAVGEALMLDTTLGFPMEGSVATYGSTLTRETTSTGLVNSTTITATANAPEVMAQLKVSSMFGKGEAGTTVIGSLTDTAKFAGNPNYSVLNISDEIVSSMSPSQFDRLNAEAVNAAAQRGDTFMAVTDPEAHALRLGANAGKSRFLTLELRMLDEYQIKPVSQPAPAATAASR